MNPLVAILCGSDAGLPKLEAAKTRLQEFGIPFEIRVLSAQRDTHQTSVFAESAEDRLRS